MDNFVFIINGRFVVDIDKNEVLDRKTKATNRLEPRLMKLLCLFVKQRGQLLRREHIISEIWNDYPGGNEGLNQAVSFLRKILDDQQKTLIKTLSKSGYVFDSEIKSNHKEEQLKTHLGLVVTTVVLLLLLILLAADIYLRKDFKQVNINERRDAEISRLDSIHQAEQMKNFSKDASGKSTKQGSMQVNINERRHAEISRLDSIHQEEQMKNFTKDASGKSTKQGSMQVNINERRHAEISRLDSIHQEEQMKNFTKDASGKSKKKDSSSNK